MKTIVGGWFILLSAVVFADSVTFATSEDIRSFDSVLSTQQGSMVREAQKGAAPKAASEASKRFQGAAAGLPGSSGKSRRRPPGQINREKRETGNSGKSKNNKKPKKHRGR